MNQEKNDFKEFSIRVPEWLKAALDNDARENKRNRNQQINVILEAHYAAVAPFSGAAAVRGTAE